MRFAQEWPIRGNWRFGMLLLWLGAVPTIGASQMHARHLNVVMILADDLRVEPLAQTPNLDRLASRSRNFANAHCQQAVCNPSRASLFSGLRPDTLEIWNLESHFRQKNPNVVTLPQYFKDHGYRATGIGKNYHNWLHEIQGDPQSWTDPEELHWGRHDGDVVEVFDNLPDNLATHPSCECRDVPDESYIDGRIAKRATERLRELSKEGQRFFLSVGFWKPHKPFNAPKRYWDLYARDDIPLAESTEWPIGTDRVAWHPSPEMLGWSERQEPTAEQTREIRHGYLASVSFLDEQVGKVLREVERLKLTESTVVVFCSDHGYHLGEHTLWAKTSNFELDTRVPLMISIPNMVHPGEETNAPVELVDLYPTLVDLCALPEPSELEGVSLRPLLIDPTATVKDAAISQFPRPAYYSNNPSHMGYTARTLTHRYTEWRDWKSGRVVARELYDHRKDPHETRNRVNEESSGLVAELASLLPTTREHLPEPTSGNP